MQSPRCTSLPLFLGSILVGNSVLSDEPPASDTRAAQPGHSVHSESFNEGPRQAAYLMNGMGNVHWEISTKNAMAQRFFDQGIVQLHGFWYFEAERSFRQAAAFDAECPILYWGMARANIENAVRSRGFIEQAMKRIANANPKEKRLIEAWSKRVKLSEDESKKPDEGTTEKKSPAEKRAADKAKKRDDEKRKKDQKDRLKQYVTDLEQIAYDYPDDIEIKAMLALQYWQNNGSGNEIQSHFAINALLSDIFHANPKHPAHHFRIHLWDYRKEQLALDAAAKCGPAAPGIAHMWHMPGHTYSRLHRYQDAAWQQEASARVDHAHMLRDQIMPDQIHNYAHNNEWLVRDLILTGRVQDAINLAKNMVELPRHPKYNKLSGRGSASLGRDRLLSVLTSYRLWPQLIELANSAYLEPTDDELRQDEIKAWQTIAHCNAGNTDRFHAMHSEFKSQIENLQHQVFEAKEALRPIIEKEEKKPDGKAIRPPKLLEPYELSEDPFGEENDPALPKIPSKDIPEDEMNDWSEERREKSIALRSLQHRLGKLLQFAAAIDAYHAAKEGRFQEALSKSHECRPVINSVVRMEWLAEAGFAENALKRIEKRIKDGPNELIPLASGVWIASKNNLKDEKIQLRCKAIAEALCPIAAVADLDVAILNRLIPTIEQLGLKDRWRVPAKAPLDLGDRPSLDSLGPFRWTPPLAPVWSAQGSDGELKSTKHFADKPLILILYLGFGCVHCAEQLKEFSPKVEEFRKAGIEVAAISTESLAKLQSGLRNYDDEMKIPLIANPELDIFKEFRCFDDFEGVPLHGTFLIDQNGRIRWQDIGHEPFMGAKFLLEESARLLKL
jgi:peroxiredoxin